MRSSSKVSSHEAGDYRRRLRRYGGEGGIRTPDRLAPMPHFECGAFNHSATSPEGAIEELRPLWLGR